MNFAEAAKEAVNWIGSHPIDDVLCGLTAVFALTAGIGKYMEYREERRAMKEISDRLPKTGHIEITADKTLEYYEPDGRLKYRVPFSSPK